MATSPVEQDSPNERRMNLRRARSAGGSSHGFSSGVSTQSESYRSEHEDDDLADEVRANVPRIAGPAPTMRGDAEPDDPHRNRRLLQEAAMAGDANYAKEFRLNLLHKLLMRGISLDNIARELGVSISTVQRDRLALKARLRQAARELDINEIVGGQTAFYDEITALSLRITSHTDTPTAMKLASMRTALAANADKTRFLSSAGVFEVLQFRRAEDGQDLSDVQVLMQRTGELLEQLSRDEPDESPARPSRIVRRPRKGGFSAMSFDDPDASSSSGEVVEL